MNMNFPARNDDDDDDDDDLFNPTAVKYCSRGIVSSIVVVRPDCKVPILIPNRLSSGEEPITPNT